MDRMAGTISSSPTRPMYPEEEESTSSASSDDVVGGREAEGTSRMSVSSSLLRRERMSARRVVPDLLGRGVGGGGVGVGGVDDDVMVQGTNLY